MQAENKNIEIENLTFGDNSEQITDLEFTRKKGIELNEIWRNIQ